MDPRAWNRFGYGYSNPVKFVDPSGHIPVPIIAAGIGLFALGGLGGHWAATSAGYEMGSPQWYGAVGLGGAFAVASGGLGYYGFGGWALAAGIVGDTVVDTAILGDDFGSSLVRNAAFNIAPDVIGYAAGRVLRNFKTSKILSEGLSPADLEYKALRRQGYTPEEAYNLMRQFNAGINPDNAFGFHFTSIKGGIGITNEGFIRASKLGARGKGIYAGTTPTPSFLLKHAPYIGWGLGPTPVRIPIKIRADIPADMLSIPPQTMIFRTSDGIRLTP